MGSLSHQLEAYADELDSGRWRQIRHAYTDDGNGKCATEVLCIAIGNDVSAALRVSDLIVDEVHRLVPGTWSKQTIAALNDTSRIPFSIFAQAARTAAWRERLKEQERTYGAPIESPEDADRLPAV